MQPYNDLNNNYNHRYNTNLFTVTPEENQASNIIMHFNFGYIYL